MSYIGYVAKMFGLCTDFIRTLSENVPSNCDVYIATYYPTAMSLYLSGVRGKNAILHARLPRAG